MDWGRSVFRGVLAGVMALAAVPALSPVLAQTSVTLTEPPVTLLPGSFGGWKRSGNGSAAAGPEGSLSLVNVNKQALEECSPQRSAVEQFGSGGRTMRVEAIEFSDRTGVDSAFTLVERPEMRPGSGLGEASALGDGAVLFKEGDSLVLASPAGTADMPALRELAKGMPKVTGNRGVEPLLPSLAPAGNRVPGSLRYALGPATYAGEGGVLPANSLAWDKSAEAVTATYNVKHGRETLTLLLYPTPQIAGAMERRLNGGLASLGPAFSTAKVRRENEMVMVASGSLPADQAQAMLAGVHLKQEVTIDRDVQPVFHNEVQKTFSLLTNIAILSGVLMGTAVLLGLFLGGGRALYRVMRGKPAAMEPEFLSLHLSPQNKAPRFDAAGPSARS
jgi:hypothetical protein